MHLNIAPLLCGVVLNMDHDSSGSFSLDVASPGLHSVSANSRDQSHIYMCYIIIMSPMITVKHESL